MTTPLQAPHGKAKNRPPEELNLAISGGGSIAENIAGAGGPPIVLHRSPTIQKAFNPTDELLRAQSSIDSLSSNHESIDLEDSTQDLADLKGDIEIPATVTCSIHVTLDCSPTAQATGDLIVHYREPNSYQEIERLVENQVNNARSKALSEKQLYFKYGNCTLIGEDVERIGIPLTTQDDWGNVCTILVSFWKSKPRRLLHLHVFMDYFSYRSRASSEKSFAGTKRSEMLSFMERASDGRRYFPRTVLMRFLTPGNIREIVLQDARLDLSMREKEDFIHNVQAKAPDLLAMCVYAGLKMECLKALLWKGLTDAALPLDYSHCCHSECEAEFDILIDRQGGFGKTATFDTVGEHHTFHRSVVIPIHYQPVDLDEDAFVIEGRERDWDKDKRGTAGDKDSLKWKSCCGHGAYSNVYRVKIDREHHKLSRDKNADFALKEFKDLPQRGDADFSQELRMLNELRKYPHKYIVTHLATWTQDGKYYMLFPYAQCNLSEYIVTHLATWTQDGKYYILFPYAQCNLREYMSWTQFGNPSKKNIIWLLRQLRGLAEALKDIHNLPTSVAPSFSAPNLSAPLPELRKSGWHHDLKPENILLYRGPENKRGTFQISDFGSGKIHTYRSGSMNTNSPNGTPTYEPPESRSKGPTSRPYDMWSLGCVFFEILIWAVMDFQSVETFAEERDGRRYPDSQSNVQEDDAFWQMTPNGEVTRRKAVDEWITDLRKKTSKPGQLPFEKVLDLVVRMLEIEPRTRITALDLWDTVNRIYTQTKIDLKDITDESLPDDTSPVAPSSTLMRLSLEPPDRRPQESRDNRPFSLNPNQSFTSRGRGKRHTNPPEATAAPKLNRNQSNNQPKTYSSGGAESLRPRRPSIPSPKKSMHNRKRSTDEGT